MMLWTLIGTGVLAELAVAVLGVAADGALDRTDDALEMMDAALEDAADDALEMIDDALDMTDDALDTTHAEIPAETAAATLYDAVLESRGTRQPANESQCPLCSGFGVLSTVGGILEEGE
ncbi:hypothetical protein PMIN03_004070 [Paraphaeosphaeria minitans]